MENLVNFQPIEPIQVLYRMNASFKMKHSANSGLFFKSSYLDTHDYQLLYTNF
jgi:hypothetical protein